MPTPETVQTSTSNGVVETRQRLRIFETAYSKILRTGDPELIAVCAEKVNAIQIELIKRRAGTWKES